MKRFFAIFLLLFFAAAAHAQLRGAWIASVRNIDWPSSQNLSAREQQQELGKMLDGLKELGISDVFLQVRPDAAVLWPSDLEPYSSFLTGVCGKDPGYDPLAFAVKQAHMRGLKLHAWFNPYRAKDKGSAPLCKNHPAVKHPAWVIPYGEELIFDPGNPAAQKHIIKIIMQAVKKYDIDGVHLDDYFYPYPVARLPFNDDKTYKKYAKKNQSLQDWRRENINNFIRSLRRAVKKAKPGIAFGISPFGIWCNAAACEGGSATRGLSANTNIYADSRLWLREGLLDYIIPQLYWPIGFKAAPHEVLLDWWSKEVRAANNGTKFYVGVGLYQFAAGMWSDEDELLKQAALAQTAGNVEGFVYFSAKDILSNKRGAKKIIASLNNTAL
ncbi:MAG: family 10 glycosylhydrolase [Elusimicrobiota bacterium]|jgi:uncharacterized lipoprotein YddW (UPF0748 family)|nr:family 10 glycosylhydrolase [Elusimicrobiota bacterium]